MACNRDKKLPKSSAKDRKSIIKQNRQKRGQNVKTGKPTKRKDNRLTGG